MVNVIASDEKRQRAAALVLEGDSMQWSNPTWRRELAAWMHPRRQGDGLAVPGLVAPMAQAIVRTFDMGNGIAAKNRQLADASQVLAVIGIQGNSVSDWMCAGQALERVLLSAHSDGLQASYLNQPIQVASLRSRLQSLLDREGFPRILLRPGFSAEEIEASTRCALDEVIGS